MTFVSDYYQKNNIEILHRGMAEVNEFSPLFSTILRGQIPITPL